MEIKQDWQIISDFLDHYLNTHKKGIRVKCRVHKNVEFLYEKHCTINQTHHIISAVIAAQAHFMPSVKSLKTNKTTRDHEINTAIEWRMNLFISRSSVVLETWTATTKQISWKYWWPKLSSPWYEQPAKFLFPTEQKLEKIGEWRMSLRYKGYAYVSVTSHVRFEM